MGNVVSIRNDELRQQNAEQLSIDHQDDVAVKGEIRHDPANDLKREVLSRLIIDERDPYFLASAQGFIVHANNAYRTMAVSSAGALALSPEMGGSGRLTLQVQAVVDEVKSSGETARYTERLKVDGQEKIFSTKYLPVFNEDQDIVGIVGTYRDITHEKERAERSNEFSQRFNDFARATSDWFWETDRQLQFKMISDRFTAVTGRPAALMLGAKLTDLGEVLPNYQGDAPGFVAWEEKKAFRDQLVEVANAEGDILKIHLSGVPVFDRETGDFQGYRGAGMDVTQQYQYMSEASDIRVTLELALKELTRKNIELDKANASAASALMAKDEFLATMSHELRTPLNAILGFSELLDSKAFGPMHVEYHESAQNITQAGRYLLGLIEDILDSAMIEAGKVKVEKRSTNLKSLLEKAHALSSFKANEKNITPIEVEDTIDFEVMVDEKRATQVFVNLLVNAYKFSKPGDKVGLVVRRIKDGMIAVTIWDTGVGIAPDEQLQIFERFGQADSNENMKAANNACGVGLGLHISRELVRLMGGDIKLVSELGKGSAFTVTLPEVSVN